MTSTTSNNSNNSYNIIEQENISIANAKIIFVVAESGCGKTFTGDYLSLLHNFHHVDGDGPVKNMHLPKYTEMASNAFKCAKENWSKGKDGPQDQWGPYYEEITKQTIEAAKHSDQVVLTNATGRQTVREFVVKCLEEGGASKENITVLYLTIDLDVKLKGLFYRRKHLLEANGTTIETVMEEHGLWNVEEEMKCSDFIEIERKKLLRDTGKVNEFEVLPVGYATTVNISGRDMAHLDAVDDALGLTGKRCDVKISFDEIRDKVKAIDMKRNEDFATNVDISKLLKMDSNDEDSDVDDNNIEQEEEPVKIAKQRSSSIQAIPNDIVKI